jgi:hypothetical protein
MTGGRVAPILVLRARAEARSLLFRCGEFTLGEALDPLFAYAYKAGLVNMLGSEAIENIVYDAFGIEPSA